jgi:hypothetical protein
VRVYAHVAVTKTLKSRGDMINSPDCKQSSMSSADLQQAVLTLQLRHLDVAMLRRHGWRQPVILTEYVCKRQYDRLCDQDQLQGAKSV